MSDKQVIDSQQTQAEIPADVRLARILLPASILREVDQIVLAGRGGYRTRQEFFSEAIQNHILEIKHGIGEGGHLTLSSEQTRAEGDNGRRAAAAPSQTAAAPAASSESIAEPVEQVPTVKPITDLAQTALPLVPRGVTIDNGIAAVKQGPMFGLHNRDYPTLWCAIRLAQRTREGLIPPLEFLDEVTREAWDFAASLLSLEKQLKVKLTALFPTNRSKPQSAEASFHSFAVGEMARRPNADGTVNAAEALFNWGACQLTREDGRLLLGLTTPGYELIEAMEGLTLDWPHGRDHAEALIAYLKGNAPWDWEGFATLLEFVAERPDRAALAAHFNGWHPDWSETLANTNAAGYLARAREWGLLEPKLAEGRYLLTEFGDEQRKEASR